MVGIIYCIENKITGKRYIGQTISSLRQRFNEHKRDMKYNECKNKYFYNALAKYGIENFTIYPLEECIPVDMLNEKECKYIKDYDTVNSGYNISHGGLSGKALRLPNNEIKKLYLSNKSLKEIASKYGCDKTVISHRLKSMGVQIRDWNKEQLVMIPKEILEKLYVDALMTTPEIARLYNTSHQTVLKKLRQYNIPIRKAVNRKYL